MQHTSLGTRMKKNYEDRGRFYLTRRIPVIMRLDGRAFHTLTRHCDKPFDVEFSDVMIRTSKLLMRAVQGSKVCYTQSDEISILITDFDNLDSEAWFDYNVQKITSISAGIASAYFTASYTNVSPKQVFRSDLQFSVFDCRVFNIPKEEVGNYFYWRFIDWVRNSVSMLAQSHYSHKELHKKNQEDMHEMLHQKGVNWADLPDRWKNGTFIFNQTGNIIVEHPNIREDKELFHKNITAIMEGCF